jgi:hypothetical protein
MHPWTGIALCLLPSAPHVHDSGNHTLHNGMHRRTKGWNVYQVCICTLKGADFHRLGRLWGATARYRRRETRSNGENGGMQMVIMGV